MKTLGMAASNGKLQAAAAGAGSLPLPIPSTFKKHKGGEIE